MLQKIILASSSKRRENLLRQINIKNFDIIKPNFDEDGFSEKISVTKKVIEFSYRKAKSVFKKIKHNNFIIISADTEVFRCGNTYSKCKSKNEVKNCLLQLSGRKHLVFGGICLINSSGSISKKLVSTEVFFEKIPLHDLNNKELLNQGIGKAGGYAIQGLAAKYVKKIRGSYTNVVGLSLNHLNKMLEGLGFKN